MKHKWFFFLHSQVSQSSQQQQVQPSPIQADPIAAVQQQFSGSTIKAVKNEQLQANQDQPPPSVYHQV